MIEEYKELWARKYEKQGRIDITIFFVNIFLLICHIFLGVVYLIIGHTFMTCVNIISLLVYTIFIRRCYKNIERYMGIAFLEIWLHLMCGILSFGWTPCYQNWCFGMIVAYFLPAFSSDDKTSKQRPFYYAFMVILSYFLLATLYPLTDLSITMELDIYMNSLLFIANNLFTFVSIILFALFYTSSNDRKERELSRKADYDELTNLYNRHALNQISSEIIDSAKENNKSYCVAILDIDFFKKINDKYGHTTGDLVLKRLANILKIFSTKGVISGRWGGEEFIMIASHEISYSEFTELLEKMRVKISEVKFNTEKNKKISLTISIGSKEIKDYKSLEDAVALADVKLYKAKETGRNKLVK